MVMMKMRTLEEEISYLHCTTSRISGWRTYKLPVKRMPNKYTRRDAAIY
jgi:hypothetical protein